MFIGDGYVAYIEDRTLKIMIVKTVLMDIIIIRKLLKKQLCYELLCFDLDFQMGAHASSTS